MPAHRAIHFVDRGGPVMHTAQIHLLYWGNQWPSTGIYFPTPDQITAALQSLLVGPYLNELAQYRGIQPAVLRGSTVVKTSEPRSGFDDGDVADFINAQIDAGVVPAPDASDQVRGALPPLASTFREYGAFNVPPGDITIGLYPWPVWGPVPDWLWRNPWALGLLTGLGGAAVSTQLFAPVLWLLRSQRTSCSSVLEGTFRGSADMVPPYAPSRIPAM